MGLPAVRWPPWARLGPRTTSPGLSKVKYTAMFAWEPEWGWTLTCSAPKSAFAREMARFSATSTISQPP